MRTEIEYGDAIEAPSANWWLFDTQSRQNMFFGLADPCRGPVRLYRTLGTLSPGLVKSEGARGQDDMRSNVDDVVFYLRASD